MTEQAERHKIKPRVWHTAAIERDGSVTRGADPSLVSSSDFHLPSSDESTQQALYIKLRSLSLCIPAPGTSLPTASINSSQDNAIQTYSAVLHYALQTEHDVTKEIGMPLRYDVYFATAHPCIVSRSTELLISLTNPSPQISGSQTGALFRGRGYSQFNNELGHLLHKNFSDYKIVSLFDLLVSSSNRPPDSLHSPFDDPLNAGTSSPETTTPTRPKVLVVDCTDASMTAYPVRPAPSPKMTQADRHGLGSDIEVLARGLCAYRGWNALISRQGMGCLSCAIREAAALEWSVVLRFA